MSTELPSLTPKKVIYEKRDYLKLQDDLFAGMTVRDIYKQAKEYAERKQKY